jgi:hypothetical protein
MMSPAREVATTLVIATTSIATSQCKTDYNTADVSFSKGRVFSVNVSTIMTP